MRAVLRDTRRSVASWCRRHTIGGDGAVVTRRTDGPEQADPLTREQELDLIDVLRGRLPDQVGFDEELWTRQSVAELVEHLYDIPMTPRIIGRYLRGWGLGPREPVERACGLCAGAVAHWVDTEYPAIVRSALDHHAELYWVGRTRLHGVAPTADVLSAVSARGRIRFMITTPWADRSVPRDFLLRLSGADHRTVHVVVDGSWASVDSPRRTPARIVLHPLPSCGRGTATRPGADTGDTGWAGQQGS
ncbi:winged helix-turn-helix domain-containing protein [Polymorphospora lycopeni]|uniref:Winged helix-turn-helix domain-containing protein n=1 Tax=Polymorphospora lycopeni TaxID=3140240 RepID=A0ABV5CXI7_9ACTN